MNEKEMSPVPHKSLLKSGENEIKNRIIILMTLQSSLSTECTRINMASLLVLSPVNIVPSSWVPLILLITLYQLRLILKCRIICISFSVSSFCFLFFHFIEFLGWKGSIEFGTKLWGEKGFPAFLTFPYIFISFRNRNFTGFHSMRMRFAFSSKFKSFFSRESAELRDWSLYWNMLSRENQKCTIVILHTSYTLYLRHIYLICLRQNTIYVVFFVILTLALE